MVAHACNLNVQEALKRIEMLQFNQPHGEFETSLGYKERPCLKKQR